MHSFETLAFYRGVNTEMPLDRPTLVRTRKNRKPRDTAPHIHEAADAWFRASFGVGYRSEAVFLTSSRFTAQLYGKSPDHCYRVIPLGRYSFCWSSKFADFLHLAKDVPSAKELTIRLLNAGYTDTNLEAAHKSGNELMLFCEMYIAVPVVLLAEPDVSTSTSSLLVNLNGSFY